MPDTRRPLAVLTNRSRHAHGGRVRGTLTRGSQLRSPTLPVPRRVTGETDPFAVRGAPFGEPFSLPLFLPWRFSVPGSGFDSVPLAIVGMTAYAYAMAIFSRGPSDPQSAESPLVFVILVPCLNEANVIGRTVQRLIGLRGAALTIVIDDASDDDSRSVVEAMLPNPRVQLLRRTGTDSRIGKGEALNAGYREILRLVTPSHLRPDQIIVCVFDADGRVDEGFFDTIAPYFADPGTVGVQAAVRMYNARYNVLTAWQNTEFIIWGDLFARAKDRIGSATLGGNGQCVRLSALMALGNDPWRPSLTEDLDLSIRLLLNGGRLRFCAAAAVFQEAIPSLRALIRQRGRWMQGHFASWQYLRAVLRAPMPLSARVDLAIFLLIPILFVPIGVATVGSWLNFAANLGSWTIEGFLLWYLFGFPLAPLIVMTIHRRGGDNLPKSVWQAHAYFAYSAVWLAAACVAVGQILLGRRRWAKTSRLAEKSG